MSERPAPRVAIIGSGMSGLCMGARLLAAGIDSFTIFEKADRIGGTWRENTYPGLTCDVPSHFYQYSFAPNPHWSSLFSPGSEIWAYFERTTDELGIRPHIRFETAVVRAAWNGEAWNVATDDGDEQVFDFLVSATGVLHHPKIPDIDGLDIFNGAWFHSARWDHHVPLAGKRVGIVGNGSTGIQIVTALAGEVAHLTMFQRTPQWVLGAPNPEIPPLVRSALARLPALNGVAAKAGEVVMSNVSRALLAPSWQRNAISDAARRYLATVRDADLRAKLTPDYEPMCKRLVNAPGFYRAVQRDDVEVVVDRIEQVEPMGVRTDDGVLHELDVLVLATGFDAQAYLRPMDLVGEGGRTLDETWAKGPHGYRTVAIPGFPNFFMLLGPHSPIGNFSLVPVAEAQSTFAMHWIEEWRAGRVDSVAPSETATQRFNDEIREAMPGTIWTTGCQSWYLDDNGLPQVWPWSPQRHRRMMEEPERSDFEVRTSASDTIHEARPTLSHRLAGFAISVAGRTVLDPRVPMPVQRRVMDLSGRTTRAAARPHALGDRHAWRLDPPAMGRRIAVLYLHGGGYCLGSPATHRPLAQHLAHAAQAPVFLLDYRLAPEHPHPAALNDATAAYSELRSMSEFDEVVVAGDSAGGGLALALALWLRDQAEAGPDRLALLSPWVDLADLPRGADRYLRGSQLALWSRAYCGEADPRSPLISPLHGDLTGLPPTLVHVAHGELLAPQIERLIRRLHQAGLDVTIARHRNAWHAVEVAIPASEIARNAVSSAGLFLGGQTP